MHVLKNHCTQDRSKLVGSHGQRLSYQDGIMMMIGIMTVLTVAVGRDKLLHVRPLLIVVRFIHRKAGFGRAILRAACSNGTTPPGG